MKASLGRTNSLHQKQVKKDKKSLWHFCYKKRCSPSRGFKSPNINQQNIHHQEKLTKNLYL
ncbi:hypothetical protein H663_004250 [Limnohabitans planktonicus II-D5]|uniref:Uncharacterized protein n=1 Tax=Limnohabitans planktonicus II-D5 TaxID=1293045 RepID=A0A2T7UHK2_9BURK|nr:hypothetical protein H663_004250 [Limnohabitans planktonicus II-D5]